MTEQKTQSVEESLAAAYRAGDIAPDECRQILDQAERVLDEAKQVRRETRELDNWKLQRRVASEVKRRQNAIARSTRLAGKVQRLEATIRELQHGSGGVAHPHNEPGSPGDRNTGRPPLSRAIQQPTVYEGTEND